MTEDTVQTRSVETEIEIDAPVDAVWKALTDAEELTRWFPLEARVEPGVGGRVWASFGNQFEGEATIEVWEPEKHFAVSYPQAPPVKSEATEQSGSGQVQTDQPGASPVKVATDYILEAREGKTVLRLVHSGFGAAAEWDNLYEATRQGWDFQLRGLRHYLERHRGTPRIVVSLQAVLGELPLEEAWKRLMSRQGLLAEGSLEQQLVGKRYSIRTSTGELLEGVLHSLTWPMGFSATVKTLNDSYFRVWLDPPLFSGMPGMMYLWLSTYGLPGDQVAAIRRNWAAMIESLFSELRSAQA